MNKFKQDALRWIVPGQIGEPAQLSNGLLLRLCLRHRALRAMGWYRFACWAKEHHIRGVFRLVMGWLFFRFGLEIWGDIGGGLYIAHPQGVMIGVTSMGENCSVIAAATLGMRNEYAFPTVGDNVFIGAGARVLGDVTIGDHARIGANAVVIHDVPARATAVGIPARVQTSNAPPKAPSISRPAEAAIEHNSRGHSAMGDPNHLQHQDPRLIPTPVVANHNDHDTARTNRAPADDVNN